MWPNGLLIPRPFPEGQSSEKGLSGGRGGGGRGGRIGWSPGEFADDGDACLQVMVSFEELTAQVKAAGEVVRAMKKDGKVRSPNPTGRRARDDAQAQAGGAALSGSATARGERDGAAAQPARSFCARPTPRNLPRVLPCGQICLALFAPFPCHGLFFLCLCTSSPCGCTPSRAAHRADHEPPRRSPRSTPSSTPPSPSSASSRSSLRRLASLSRPTRSSGHGDTPPPSLYPCPAKRSWSMRLASLWSPPLSSKQGVCGLGLRARGETNPFVTWQGRAEC